MIVNRRAATRPTITGVERWTGEVIARLVALDPDRYVVAEPPPRARGRLLGQAWEQLALPAQAARARAALVFSAANLAPVAWPRNVLVMHDAAVLRAPHAYSAAYRLWHGRVGRAGARRALAVITVSQFSRRELISAAGVPPERLVVIPGGVSERFVAEAQAEDESVVRRLGLERPYVLTLATDDPRKNLGALSPTAASLAGHGIDLAWAGDSRPYFAPAAASSGVRPLGYIPDDHLPALYRRAEAFVLASRYEGFGLPCLEAMACGTPVVAADRAALPETCADAALLVDPDDPAAVSAAVLRAVTDPALRKSLRATGLRHAAKFTWERTARSTDAVLWEVAKGVGRQ